MSPSYLLTGELEETTTVFESCLSAESLNTLADDEVFCFSGDLKVSF